METYNILSVFFFDQIIVEVILFIGVFLSFILENFFGFLIVLFFIGYFIHNASQGFSTGLFKGLADYLWKYFGRLIVVVAPMYFILPVYFYEPVNVKIYKLKKVTGETGDNFVFIPKDTYLISDSNIKKASEGLMKTFNETNIDLSYFDKVKVPRMMLYPLTFTNSLIYGLPTTGEVEGTSPTGLALTNMPIIGNSFKNVLDNPSTIIDKFIELSSLPAIALSAFSNSYDKLIELDKGLDESIILLEENKNLSDEYTFSSTMNNRLKNHFRAYSDWILSSMISEGNFDANYALYIHSNLIRNLYSGLGFQNNPIVLNNVNTEVDFLKQKITDKLDETKNIYFNCYVADELCTYDNAYYGGVSLGENMQISREEAKSNLMGYSKKYIPNYSLLNKKVLKNNFNFTYSGDIPTTNEIITFTKNNIKGINKLVEAIMSNLNISTKEFTKGYGAISETQLSPTSFSNNFLLSPFTYLDKDSKEFKKVEEIINNLEGKRQRIEDRYYLIFGSKIIFDFLDKYYTTYEDDFKEFMTAMRNADLSNLSAEKTITYLQSNSVDYRYKVNTSKYTDFYKEINYLTNIAEDLKSYNQNEILKFANNLIEPFFPNAITLNDKENVKRHIADKPECQGLIEDNNQNIELLTILNKDASKQHSDYVNLMFSKLNTAFNLNIEPVSEEIIQREGTDCLAYEALNNNRFTLKKLNYFENDLKSLEDGLKPSYSNFYDFNLPYENIKYLFTDLDIVDKINVLNRVDKLILEANTELYNANKSIINRERFLEVINDNTGYEVYDPYVLNKELSKMMKDTGASLQIWDGTYSIIDWIRTTMKFFINGFSGSEKTSMTLKEQAPEKYEKPVRYEEPLKECGYTEVGCMVDNGLTKVGRFFYNGWMDYVVDPFISLIANILFLISFVVIARYSFKIITQVSVAQVSAIGNYLFLSPFFILIDTFKNGEWTELFSGYVDNLWLAIKKISVILVLPFVNIVVYIAYSLISIFIPLIATKFGGLGVYLFNTIMIVALLFYINKYLNTILVEWFGANEKYLTNSENISQHGESIVKRQVSEKAGYIKDKAKEAALRRLDVINARRAEKGLPPLQDLPKEYTKRALRKLNPLSYMNKKED